MDCKNNRGRHEDASHKLDFKGYHKNCVAQMDSEHKLLEGLAC